MAFTIFENRIKFPSENNKIDELSVKFLNAAKDLDIKVLTECIEDGVNINVQDVYNRNSALHYILSDELFRKNYQELAEPCLKILLQNGANPNLQNSVHQIPLDLVVGNMVPNELADLLISHGGSFVGPNGIQNTELAMKLVHKMPGVVKSALDQAVKFTTASPSRKREGRLSLLQRIRQKAVGSAATGRQTPTIELDWRYIVYNSDAPKTKGKRNWLETKFLHEVLNGGIQSQKTILPHPVVQAFLCLKHPLYWRNFGVYYFIWIIFTFIMYLHFIWSLYTNTCKYDRVDDDPQYTSTSSTANFSTEKYNTSNNGKILCHVDLKLTIRAYVILFLYTTGPLWLELRKLFAIGLKLYIREWKTYVTGIATCVVIATLVPSLSMAETIVLTWEYPVAALGMLVGSIAISIQLTPLSVFALYLEMVFKIFRRIALASIIISPILIGFFFAFKILLTNEDMGPFELLTMIVSDNDYEAMMDLNRGKFYQIVTYAVFSGFIILVIIVVVNFLIGLAVSDIRELEESAKSANSISLIRNFYIMDAAYGSTGNMWKYNSIIRNGREMTFRFCPFDGTDTRLPEKLKLDLLEIARNRCERVYTAQENTKGIDSFSSASKVKLRGGIIFDSKA